MMTCQEMIMKNVVAVDCATKLLQKNVVTSAKKQLRSFTVKVRLLQYKMRGSKRIFKD